MTKQSFFFQRLNGVSSANLQLPRIQMAECEIPLMEISLIPKLWQILCEKTQVSIHLYICVLPTMKGEKTKFYFHKCFIVVCSPSHFVFSLLFATLYPVIGFRLMRTVSDVK